MTNGIENIILDYVQKEFGEETEKNSHYSYCKFPEEACVCKYIKDIEYDTPLISGGYIDSFSMVVVLVFLEKTFNIKISDKDASPDNFDTVRKMTKLVEKYL